MEVQIDFHHGVTYIAARLAGFNLKEAYIIAHSAQYVDDATNGGSIKFKNGATYSRIATAHKMLDYSNFSELANHRAWVPFHFLPGNNLKAPNANLINDGRFVYRLICQPGSRVAEDMVRDCILSQDQPFSLHRLGITMHVYIDTWAHYGFCGMTHEINRAKEIKLIAQDGKEKVDTHITQWLKSFFTDKFDDMVGDFVSSVQPLGHGAVLSYPDQPYLRWKYINGLGDLIVRDNPKDYEQAIVSMHRALVRYRLRDAKASVPPMQGKDYRVIRELMNDLTDTSGDKRHGSWLDAIRQGKFSFGAEEVLYIPKGKGSWKYQALGTEKAVDHPDDVYDYTEAFLTSNWKMFHDAALAHRFNILHNILPKYGICVG